ncbi:MAG: transglutaminase-like cysteine peptidase [Desulfobulbaceae bacterium]|nr:transglutaminase-like cysteine peptidase [Desulfobulbaceae bacterium]
MSVGRRIISILSPGGIFPVKKRCFLSMGIMWLLMAAAIPVFTSGTFSLDEKTLAQAAKEYGPGARERLEAWVRLIREDQSGTDMEKLEKVNSFFNQVQFVDDSIHWKQEDYWATPIELLASNGGDCEDFSIGKYFTLKIMGVSEEKLNMTYVKALRLNQAHMVITYYERPGAEPLVLDNLNEQIKPASQRQDLLPVYSFNGISLWIAKQRGKGKMVGSSERLGQWKNLLERMPEGLN